MHRAIRAVAASVAAAVTAVTLSACGGAQSTDKTDTADAQAESLLTRIEAGEVTIGTKFDQPGLGLRGDDGTMSGLDVDIATHVVNAIAEDHGWSAPEITWKEALPAKREEMITSGDVDMVAATYSINQERAGQVSFGGPYLLTYQALMVPNADTDINGMNDLDGKVLCSAAGSWPAEMLITTLPDIDMKERDTYSQCIEELRSGSVDAVTTDELILAGYAASNPGEFRIVELTVRGAPLSMERYGIGVRKGDGEATDAINKALQAMLDDGTFDHLVTSNIANGVKVEKDVPGDLSYLN